MIPCGHKLSLLEKQLLLVFQFNTPLREEKERREGGVSEGGRGSREGREGGEREERERREEGVRRRGREREGRS